MLEGAGAFAAGEWAPLLRAGDTVGAKWTPEGVVMPEGFGKAYRDYVEGGWGSIGVPETFCLAIRSDALEARCRIISQTERRIEVEFC